MSNRRIDQLKYQASLMPLTKDQVREFGHLTKTETWEKAIAFHKAVDKSNKWIDPLDTSDMPVASEWAPIQFPRTNSLAEWIGTPKMFAIVLGAISIFLLATGSLPYLTKFVPVKITIQIGAK